MISHNFISKYFTYWPYLLNFKTAWFKKQTFSLVTDSTCTTELTSNSIRWGKLIRTIELQYYVNIWASFNLIKSGSLSRFSKKRLNNHLQSSECFIYQFLFFMSGLIRMLEHFFKIVNLKLSKLIENETLYSVINTHDNI